MSKLLKVNVVIDLDKVRKQVKKDSEGYDLESSGGSTPDDLARDLDEMNSYFPENCQELVDAFGKLVDILVNIHEKGKPREF